MHYINFLLVSCFALPFDSNAALALSRRKGGRGVVVVAVVAVVALVALVVVVSSCPTKIGRFWGRS